MCVCVCVCVSLFVCVCLQEHRALLHSGCNGFIYEVAPASIRQAIKEEIVRAVPRPGAMLSLQLLKD